MSRPAPRPARPYWTPAVEARMRELGKSASRVALDSSGPDDPESVSQAFVSGLLSGKYRLYRVGRPKLRALARGLEWSLNELVRATGVARDGVGLEPEPDGDLERLALAAGAFHPAALVPVYPAGTGPAWDDADVLERAPQPNGVNGNVRVVGLKAMGESMAPYLERGEVAYIALDPATCAPGAYCAVWLPDEGMVVKKLVEARPDGSLLLESLNPAALFRAPAGSSVVGRVVRRLKND